MLTFYRIEIVQYIFIKLIILNSTKSIILNSTDIKDLSLMKENATLGN